MNESQERVNLSKNLKRMMEIRGLTAADLSRALNTPYTTVNDWINGKTFPRPEKQTALAKFFDVTVPMLIEKDMTLMMHKIRPYEVPIYSCISCGTGVWIDENPLESVGVPSQMMFSGKPFANFAEGDSMEPGIHQGDLLIFQETPMIASGQIGSFSLNGEYYCKRFKQLPDGSCWLFSDNSEYEPIPIRKEDNFRILGLYKLKLSKEQ